jgi:hypothetical protein
MSSRIQGTGYEKNIEDHANEYETNKELKGKHVFLSNRCSCPRTTKDDRRAIVRKIRRVDYYMRKGKA